MTDVRSIYGIGFKKASELKHNYNIRTIYSLRKYVRKLPDIITDVQRAGLKYHDKISNRITRAEADRHVKFIRKYIKGSIIAGSYRRGEKKIGDIDVLVTGDLSKVVDILTKKKYIVASLSLGDEKFSGIVKLPDTYKYRRIDIVKTTKKDLPFALLYFTGDVIQNISMRQTARGMGYSLSQHGLTNNGSGRMVPNIKSEKDIFKFLKIPYKPPEGRSHKKEEKK